MHPYDDTVARHDGDGSTDERTFHMARNKTLKDHAGDLAESLAPAVGSAREKAGPFVADARAKAAPYVSDARDRVIPVFVSARDLAVPYLADARDVASPYVATARDKAAPYVSDARERVSTTFTSEVLPVVTAALAALDDATEDARGETVKRGKALAAALRGEIEARTEELVVEPPSTSSESSHWLRTVLVAMGLGGAGYAVVKKRNDKQRADSWQSSYTPPTSTTSPASTTPPTSTTPLADAATHSAADDVAASDPAEAAADATEVPHITTTPDQPVTEIDVDKR